MPPALVKKIFLNCYTVFQYLCTKLNIKQFFDKYSYVFCFLLFTWWKMYVFLQIFIEVHLFEDIFSVNIYRYFIIYLIECTFFVKKIYKCLWKFICLKAFFVKVYRNLSVRRYFIFTNVYKNLFVSRYFL